MFNVDIECSSSWVRDLDSVESLFPEMRLYSSFRIALLKCSRTDESPGDLVQILHGKILSGAGDSSFLIPHVMGMELVLTARLFTRMVVTPHQTFFHITRRVGCEKHNRGFQLN